MPYGAPASYSASHRASAVPRRHVDLVGQFAGEADPADPGRDARDGRVAPRHEREVVVRPRPGRGASAPSTSRERGPTRATVAHCSVTEVQWTRRSRPLGLQPLLHPVQYRGRVAGRRGDQEAVLGEADDRAVVEDHAVRVAHHAVADHADLQGAHHVGVEPVEEDGRVRALYVDLAEGGGVHEGDALAGGARTRAARRSPCPRRPAGSTRAASTGRRSRTGRRARRASRAGRSCGPGRTARRGRGRRAWRRRPARTGGRNVVVPSAEMSTPSSSATTPLASTPEVLPWSLAVPAVV